MVQLKAVREVLFGETNQISIPYGSIKSWQEVGRCKVFVAFQFLMVQLKVDKFQL